MAWDFSTEPEFQEQLDWMAGFLRERIRPLDVLWPDEAFQPLTDERRSIVDPLKQQVRDRGLWACHLGPELGGQGYGQLKLALMNELIGLSPWAPIVFGVQAPDTGNAEVLAHYGTDEQKARYLQPLLDGEAFSCFAMTEPQGGSDPLQFTTRARRDGEGWVLHGEKFFASNVDVASFVIALAVTDPDADPYRRMSMFLVERDTSGFEIERMVGLMGDPPGTGHHGHVRFDGCQVPGGALLGEPGQGFEIAQTRLGGGRIHHAMRLVGACQQALDLMCERAVSRRTKGRELGDHQAVQQMIADSYVELTQFRLLVLRTAWLIDHGSTREARRDIAACKIAMARTFHDIVRRAVQLHGAVGVSNETPLGRLWMTVPVMSLVDGPTEVHRTTVARQLLKEVEPHDGPWPSAWLPELREDAERRLGATTR